MTRTKKLVGAYDVSGPNSEDRTGLNESHAISVAQFLATAWGKPGTWYVRKLGNIIAHVERDKDGIIRTIRK